MAKWKTRTYRKIVVIAIAILLVGGMLLSATYGVFDTFAGRSTAHETPGETVAVVNGAEIGRKDFENLFNHMRNSLLLQGMEPDSKEGKELLEQLKMQVLQQMINNLLLLQEAEEKGIIPNDEEIQSSYDEILANYQDEKTFKEQLSNANITVESLKKEIAESLTIEKYIEYYLKEKVDERDLVVTEEELKELYEQRNGQEEDLPGYEEMKPELLETLKNQKSQLRLQELLEELYENSEIDILL